ncbi:MAG: hypothetical protein ACTSRW_07680 [Candidatus Helarchaeota archaeon]
MRKKAVRAALLSILISFTLETIAFVFNHQSVTALMIDSSYLMFFDIPLSSYFVLDVSYCLFFAGFIIPVLIVIFSSILIK